MSESIVLFHALLEKAEAIINESNTHLIANAERLIADSKAILKEEELKNRSYSHHFNPLRYFQIGEVTHSRILADILDPNGIHGQGRQFLDCFLKKLNYTEEIFFTSPWHITAERDHVDIRLVCKAGDAVILVENKSNDAVDQQNQLYRYWFQNIYRLRNDINLASKDLLGKVPAHCRIVYLPADKAKKPKEHSFERPLNRVGFINGPEQLCSCTNCIQYWSFKEEVKSWLKECIDNLPESNYRYRAFLEQYIETF